MLDPSNAYPELRLLITGKPAGGAAAAAMVAALSAIGGEAISAAIRLAHGARA